MNGNSHFIHAYKIVCERKTVKKSFYAEADSTQNEEELRWHSPSRVSFPIRVSRAYGLGYVHSFVHLHFTPFYHS